MENLNFLFTSVGRRSYLVEYFKKALNGRGMVHVANSSANSPVFLVADKSVVTPLIYDNNYVDFLIDYCKCNHIHAIISLFDIDLPILAENKQRFASIGVRVIVSDPNVIEVCNDKWKTYQFLLAYHIGAPNTFLDLSEAISAIHSGLLQYPVMIKPRWGMGSIAVFEADNEDELRCFYNKVHSVIQKTYLKYESRKTFKHCVLIQEKLKGQEYGLDVINDLDGNYMNTSVKLKCAMRSGETDCAVTADNQSLREVGEELSKIHRHIGNLDVDAFITEEGIYVLEMNARFGGGYPFSHVAGVDLPQAIVNWLLGNETPRCLFEPNIGVMAQKDIKMVVLSNSIKMS